MDIKALEQSIEHQSRNGRQQIYISTAVLKQLVPDFTSTELNVFVDKTQLEELINKYKEQKQSKKEQGLER